VRFDRKTQEFQFTQILFKCIGICKKCFIWKKVNVFEIDLRYINNVLAFVYLNSLESIELK